MEELIFENKNLIYSITRYFEKYSNKEDLFQAGCIGIIMAYKNYNPDILNFLKWKFKQENSKIARKYFLEICKKNNFLIPNLKSEIDELSWRWTHSIWDIFYECLNDKKANEELNNYVNSIKKNNKLLAYRISLLQESKSLVKNK